MAIITPHPTATPAPTPVVAAYEQAQAALPAHIIIVAICQPEHIRALCEDMIARLTRVESAQIVRMGATRKAKQRFLLIRFLLPDGLTAFLNYLRDCEQVTDYLTFDPSTYDPATFE
jgi:hypothetical protein